MTCENATDWTATPDWLPGSSGLPGELVDLLEDFTGYLRRERSLASTTVENYLNQVRPFVVWYAQHRQIPLSGLTIRDVNGFLAWRSGSCAAGSLRVAATALRALLRWMFLDGRLDRQLADGIGPVHYPALAGVPKALSAADLAFDPDSISFAQALRLIRRTATGTAAIPPADWADRLPVHLAQIALLLIPDRRERTCPRAVKRARHNSYRVKKPGEPASTRHRAPATIHLRGLPSTA